jgi:hypothetical protein
MRIHIYDGTIPGLNGDITVPLAPLTATLTGCAGTVLVGDLTYNGSNSLAWRTAVRNVAVNYLCSLGYVENTNFIATAATALTDSPAFRARKNPAGVWLGVRSGTGLLENEYIIDRFGDGSDIYISSSSSTSSFTPLNLDFTRTVASDCGNVVRTERWRNSQSTPNWYTVNFTGSVLNSVLTNTEQTCPINLYDFDPPECEGAEWFWQYSFDGLEDYVTVQIGGTQFEPEEQGFYRILYICNGCEYIYEFTYFIF